MRIGSRTSNEFMEILNKKYQEIQEKYLETIKNITKSAQLKVMLGDSTITDQKSFDPQKTREFYQKIINKLPDWSHQGISFSNNEDIRRIFAKFEVREGNYLLSGHMSLQFHVLLYYRPEYRVVECQKELSKIIDLTKNSEEKIAQESDEYILQKLEQLGYKDLDHDSLFEIFFKNDKLRNKIYEEIDSKSDVDFKSLASKKQKLFDELDSYLMEVYHTSPVLIDDTRLISGEEGCLFTLDLEFIKNKNKEGMFDPRKIPESVKSRLTARLDHISQTLEM